MNEAPRKSAQAVTLTTFIREVPGSNLGVDIDLTETHSLQLDAGIVQLTSY
jgi:hypothetical protein